MTDTLFFLDYQGWKVIHVAGVVIFLGNIVVTGVWKVLADRTRHPQTVAFAQRLVTLTDWVFTAGGVAVLLAGAYGMLTLGDWNVANTAWLWWGIALFSASGVIWAAVLLPVQVMQERIAKTFAAGGDIPARYWRLGKVWIYAGVLATVLPAFNLFFMIVKP